MQSQAYQIPSATTPGVEYLVTVHADGVLSCSCPDATYRRRQCKHQRFVIATRTAHPTAVSLIDTSAALAQQYAAAHDAAAVQQIVRGY